MFTYNVSMKLYLYTLVAAVVVFLAHRAGLNGLYYSIFQYDIYMHIFGGLTIALFLIALASSFKPDALNRRKNIVLGVFIIGLGWELFEAYFNIAGAPVGTKAYYIDTIKDLIDDIIGSSLGAFLFIKK